MDLVLYVGSNLASGIFREIYFTKNLLTQKERQAGKEKETERGENREVKRNQRRLILMVETSSVYRAGGGRDIIAQFY